MKNVIKVKIKNPVIEIPLVDENDKVVHTIKFDKSDTNMKRVETMRDKVVNELGEFATKNEEDFSFDELKNTVSEMVDGLLGEETFNILYGLTPSLEIVINYFIEICMIIGQETEKNLADPKDRR